MIGIFRPDMFVNTVFLVVVRTPKLMIMCHGVIWEMWKLRSSKPIRLCIRQPLCLNAYLVFAGRIDVDDPLV